MLDEAVARRARKLFLALVVVLTTAVYVPIIRAGSLGALGGLALPLIMWAPGIAGMIASLLCYRSLRPCGFAIHRRTWSWLLAAWVIPAAYTLLIYVPLGALGVVSLGPPNLTVDFLIIGLGQSLLFATGEEIGWRGFFTPLMTARYGFLRGNIFVGAVWAAYHYPAILFGGYGFSANLVFGMLAFTLTVICLSIFLGASRLRSGSMWPAALFHAVHNNLFLHFFDPVKRTSTAAAWLAGEQGLLLCVVMLALAGAGLTLYRREPAAACAA